MRTSALILALATPLLLAGAALAQTKPAAAPAAPAVDVTKAVQCQTLLIQFNERVGASKAADDVKKTARESLAAGNKACNEKNYDAGMEQIRTALTTIEVKPLY